MGVLMLWVVFWITFTNCSLVLGYTWPNPHLDELESQRYDRLGFNARDLASGLVPCDRFEFASVEPDQPGRLNAADWIRTVRYECFFFSFTFQNYIEETPPRPTMTWQLMTRQMELAEWMLLFVLSSTGQKCVRPRCPSLQPVIDTLV